MTADSAPAIRVCMWGTFERGFPRNRIVEEGLRRQGASVRVCHEPVWERTGDKTRGYRGLRGKLGLAGRLLLAYLRLAVRYLRQPRHDVLYVGYLGHFDMPLAWLLARLTRRRLVFDAFLSLYDSSVCDRRVVAEGSVTARLLWRADRWACRLADVALLDTREHIDYFARTFGLDPGKFRELLIGADDRVFAPRSAGRDADACFTVLHYGKYIPLHGISFILGAAARLQAQGSPVRFELIGRGQLFEPMRERARELGLGNVRFLSFLEQPELVEHIARADLCLGIFGDTDKAARVIPNKVYECMAVGRPVLTGDCRPVRRVLAGAVLRCPMADEAALAASIEAARADPGELTRVGCRGRERFGQIASPTVLGRRLATILAGEDRGAPAGPRQSPP